MPLGSMGQTGILSALISAQKADGSWNLTSTILQILSKSVEELRLACPVELKDNAVWATILVLAILEKKCDALHDEWELVAMKANKWLKKQTLPEGLELCTLFDSAHTVV